jgi:hypothetical protein
MPNTAAFYVTAVRKEASEPPSPKVNDGIRPNPLTMLPLLQTGGQAKRTKKPAAFYLAAGKEASEPRQITITTPSLHTMQLLLNPRGQAERTKKTAYQRSHALRP